MTIFKRLAAMPSWFLGGLAIFALVINWSVVGYMATRNDHAAVNLWRPFAKYPKAVFGVLAVLGTVSGVGAAKRSERGWFVIAGLNAATYILEFITS